MGLVTFDVSEFRGMFPAFAGETKYPDATLQNNFNIALAYIENSESWLFDGDSVKQVLYLMTSHITFLMFNASKGAQGGVVQSAAIGDVNTSFMPPPAKDMFMFWLSQSQYGQMLAAIFSAGSALTPYFGGSSERSGFRKAGGLF